MSITYDYPVPKMGGIGPKAMFQVHDLIAELRNAIEDMNPNEKDEVRASVIRLVWKVAPKLIALHEAPATEDDYELLGEALYRAHYQQSVWIVGEDYVGTVKPLDRALNTGLAKLLVRFAAEAGLAFTRATKDQGATPGVGS